MSDFMTLFQEFLGVRYFMDRILGDLQTGDDLTISINRDRGFQKRNADEPLEPDRILPSKQNRTHTP